jgi:hypothetical protein
MTNTDTDKAIKAVLQQQAHKEQRRRTAAAQRPRPRTTEVGYLRVLADALTADDWTAIVRKAIDDAKEGDAKAREWVARYALGVQPMALTELAGHELAGIEPDDYAAAAARKLDTGGLMTAINEGERGEQWALREARDAREK